MEEKVKDDQKHEEQLYKKLRYKIRSDDNRIIQIREKNNEEIKTLLKSPDISAIFQEFRPNLQAIFHFLVKNTFLPLVDRKHNNEIIL